MLGRVATFSAQDGMLAASLRTEAKVTDLQTQQASGLVSSDFGGLGAQAGRLVSLQVSAARASAYADAATQAGTTTQSMYSAMTSMTDLISTFQASLSAASSDSTGNLPTTAASQLGEFVSLLNTQVGGRYLFSGSATDTSPVVASALTASTTPTSADTSYYGGNADVASARVGQDRSIDYGVTADNLAFEKVLRAMSLIANGDTSDDALSEATDLAKEGLQGIIDVQTGVSLASSSLTEAADQQSDLADFAASGAGDINAVDVASVTAQLSSDQAQLQASYAALAKITGLSLVDYLR